MEIRRRRGGTAAHNFRDFYMSDSNPHSAESRAAKMLRIFQSGRPLTYIRSAEAQRIGGVRVHIQRQDEATDQKVISGLMTPSSFLSIVSKAFSNCAKENV